MGLGWSALTLAGHVSIVLAILALIANAVLVTLDTGKLRLTLPVQRAVCGVASALIVERLYYVAARGLINSGIDLWSKHPAPEMLSALVAGSLLTCAVTVLMAQGVRVGIASAELAAVIAAYGAIAVVFW